MEQINDTVKFTWRTSFPLPGISRATPVLYHTDDILLSERRAMHVFFAVLWHIIQFYRLIIIQKDTQSKTKNQRKPPRAQRGRSLRKDSAILHFQFSMIYFRAQTSAATAVTSSTIGNVSQTPSTPSAHASGNRIGGTAITPRSSERTNPCTV